MINLWIKGYNNHKDPKVSHLHLFSSSSKSEWTEQYLDKYPNQVCSQTGHSVST